MKNYDIMINYVRGWSKPVPEGDEGHDTHGGTIVGWSAKGIGFGELTVYYSDKDRKYHCYSECMSQAFCEAVLVALTKQWILE